MDTESGKQEKWIQLTDPKSGRPYYVEKYSKRKTWTKPAGKKITVIVNSPASHGNAELQNTWVRLRDKASNHHYYVNALTKKTTWNKPSSEDAVIVDGKIDPVTNKCLLLHKKSASSDTNSETTSEETWETFTDPNSKREYYVSSKDGRRTWNKPKQLEALKQVANASASASASSKSDSAESTSNWKCFVDPNSKKEYYVNTETGQKTWHRPAARPSLDSDADSVSSRRSEVWAVDLNDLDRTLVKVLRRPKADQHVHPRTCAYFRIRTWQSLSEIQDFSVRGLDKHLLKCFKGLKEGWNAFRVQKAISAMIQIANRKEKPTTDYFADNKFIRLYVQFFENKKMIPAWETMLKLMLIVGETDTARDRIGAERRIWDMLISIIAEPVSKTDDEPIVTSALEVLTAFVKNDEFCTTIYRRNGFRALLEVGNSVKPNVRRLGINLLKRIICPNDIGATRLLRELKWPDIVLILKSNLYELIPSTLRVLRDRIALGVLPMQEALLITDRSSWMWCQLGPESRKVYLVMQDGFLFEYESESEVSKGAAALRKIRLHGCTLQEKAVNISGALQYGIELGFKRANNSIAHYLLASQDKKLLLDWMTAIKEVMDNPCFSRVTRSRDGVKAKKPAAGFDAESTFLNIDFSETISVSDIADNSDEGLQLLLTLLDIVSIEHANEVLSAKYAVAALTLLIQGAGSDELRKRLLRLDLIQGIVRLLGNVLTSVNTFVNVSSQNLAHVPLMESLLSICAQAICILLLPQLASSAKAESTISTRPTCKLLVNALALKCLSDEVLMLFVVRIVSHIMADAKMRTIMLESGLVMAFSHFHRPDFGGPGNKGDRRSLICPGTHMHDFVSETFRKRTIRLQQRDLASVCSSFTAQVLVNLPSPVLMLLLKSPDEDVVLRSLEALTHIASSVSRPFLVKGICDGVSTIAAVLRQSKNTPALTISTAVELVLSLTRHTDVRPMIRQGDVIGALTEVLENNNLHRKVHEMAAASIQSLLFNEPTAQTEFLVEAENGDCIHKLLKMIMTNHSPWAVEAIASVLENAASSSNANSAKIGVCGGVWSICNAIAKQSEDDGEGDPQTTTALCRALLALVKRNDENRERFLSNRSIYVSLLHLLGSRRLSVVRAALTCVESIFASVDELRLLLHTGGVALPSDPDIRKSIRKVEKRASTKTAAAVDVLSLLVMHNKSQDFLVRRLAREMLNRIAFSVDLMFALNLSLEHLMQLLRCEKLPHVLASTLSVLAERFEMGSMPPLCANLPVKQAMMHMQMGTESIPVWICLQHCMCPDADYAFLYLYENRHLPLFKFILHGTRQQMPGVQVSTGPDGDESTFVIVHAGPTSCAKVVLKAASVLEAQQWTRFLGIVSAGGITPTTLAAIDSGEDVPNAVPRNAADAQFVSVAKQELSWEHLAAEATWSRLLSLMLPSHAGLPPSVLHPLLHLFALLSTRFDPPPIPEKSKAEKGNVEKLERMTSQLRALGGNNVLTRRVSRCFHLLDEMIRDRKNSPDRANGVHGLDLTPMPFVPPPDDGVAEKLPPGLVTHMSCTPPESRQLKAALYRGFCAQVHLEHETTANASTTTKDDVLVSVNNQPLPLYCSIGHMHKLMMEIPNEGSLSVLRFVRRFKPPGNVARRSRRQLDSTVRRARSLALQTLANLSEPSHPSHDSVRSAILAGGRHSLAATVDLIRVSGERIASSNVSERAMHDKWGDVQTDLCVLKHAFRLIRNLCCGTWQYQVYSPSRKLALKIDYGTATSARERTRKPSEAMPPLPKSLLSQQDTILLFAEDVCFFEIALRALRNISGHTHPLFEAALRREMTVVFQTLGHTSLGVRLKIVRAGAIECLCNLRSEAPKSDLLWQRQTREVLDTFCGNDNLCQSLSVPQLVLLLNTKVNTVVYRAAKAIENIVHELDFDNIDKLIDEALESLKTVIDQCCRKSFAPGGNSKIACKIVTTLYAVTLQTRYHEKLAAAAVHLLLVKILTIPNLPKQAYMETVLGLTLLLQDNKELQQQLIDSSMRPAGAPVVANSLEVLCKTVGMDSPICEKLSGLIAQLATLQVFIESEQRDMVVKCLHSLLTSTFGGVEQNAYEPARESVCEALDVIFKTSNWQDFLSFKDLFPLLLDLLRRAQSPGLQAKVCNLLRTACVTRDSKIAVIRLSEFGLAQIVKISADASQARRAYCAQLLLRHWINNEEASVLSLVNVEELCLLARCGSLEVVQAVARQLANKISWGLHQPVKSLLLPDKCGWLRRRSTGALSTGAWRTRWYVIKRPHLYEYHGNSGADGEQLQRKLMLAGCRIEKIVVKKRKAIQIVIPNCKEHLVLTTKDADQTLHTWTKCLLEHISYANIDTGHIDRQANVQENKKKNQRVSLKRGLLGRKGVMLLNMQEGETLAWSDFADTDRIPLVLGLIQSESHDVALQASRILSFLLPHALSHEKSQVPKLAKYCAHGVMRFLRSGAAVSREDRGVCLQILAQCRDQISAHDLMVSDASSAVFNVLYPVATFSRVTAMPLDLSRKCMRCDTPFSRDLPAENCASCGIVVCNFCNNSPVWAIVKHAMAKVCNHCYQQSKNIRLPLVEDYQKSTFGQKMDMSAAAVLPRLPSAASVPELPMGLEEKEEEFHAVSSNIPAPPGEEGDEEELFV